jgi:hypothetical protein
METVVKVQSEFPITITSEFWIVDVGDKTVTLNDQTGQVFLVQQNDRISLKVIVGEKSQVPVS